MARSRKPAPDFIPCPFTPVIDTNETLPYHFKGNFRRHSSGKMLPLVVEPDKVALWALDQRDVTIGEGKRRQVFRVGWADYTIKGLERHIQIERKSLSDLFGTIGGRHAKFEAEIKRLHEDCVCAYVMIEASLADISVYNTDASPFQVRDEAGFGAGSEIYDDLLMDSAADAINSTSPSPLVEGFDGSVSLDSRLRLGKTKPAVVLGTISRWSMRYRNVHWIFAGNRGMAEMKTFKLLSDFWDMAIEGRFPGVSVGGM